MHYLKAMIGLEKAKAMPIRSTAKASPQSETPKGFFESARRVVRSHPIPTDVALAAFLFFVSTVWLLTSSFASKGAFFVQLLLFVPLGFRRVRPTEVFLLISAVAFAQWLLDYQLLGDVALLVGLYTVAVHESKLRIAISAGVLEAGAVMASVKWEPAGTEPRSLLFLTAVVAASLCAGLTVASGSRYLTALDERARRLEMERDQQAVIATNAERTRIARELHDIVSHSLSVVITLADAAAVVSRQDPQRATEAMSEVSEVGRHALSDMRAMLGVLRTDSGADDSNYEIAPQPQMAQIEALIEHVRATGLAVSLEVDGTPFSLEAAAELTAYRIIQEALTNTIRHANALHAWVAISYQNDELQVSIKDDGLQSPKEMLHQPGHGIEGMRERASLHGGTLQAGPLTNGGWSVVLVLPFDPSNGSATRRGQARIPA
jgi:signal transduction histidine kinase